MSYDETLMRKKDAHADSLLVEIMSTPVEEIGVNGETWLNHADGDIPMSMFPYSPDIQHLYMLVDRVVICVCGVTLVISAIVNMWLADDYLLLNKILERPDVVHYLRDAARVLSL